MLTFDPSGPLAAQRAPDSIPSLGEDAPLLCVCASWSLGGAQKICAEWLASSVEVGRHVELAIPFTKSVEMWVHPRIKVIRRDPSQSIFHFLAGLALHWSREYPGVPISAHLLQDEALQALWTGGARTNPVLHNDPSGWNGTPHLWPVGNVPVALGCAPFVEQAGRQEAPHLHWTSLRHIPCEHKGSRNDLERTRLRKRWNIEPSVPLILLMGSFKEQKNYPFAIEILRAALNLGPCVMVILGGISAGSPLCLKQTVEQAKQLHCAHALRLPGFAGAVGPWIAASDVLLNCSQYEGFSIATIEALQAGLPCVSRAFPGLVGFQHSKLSLVEPNALPEVYAQACFDTHRSCLDPQAPGITRYPRLWSIPQGFLLRPLNCPLPDLSSGALFITANLGQGGAQRSLVNLLLQAQKTIDFPPHALAVCMDSNQPDFSQQLLQANVFMRKIAARDVSTAAERLVRYISQTQASSIIFWNVDVKLKLLLSKFLPVQTHIIDVSPGDYAFERLQAVEDFSHSIDWFLEDYAQRLTQLIQKFKAVNPVWLSTAPTRRIPNGVEIPSQLCPCGTGDPEAPRFVVSGRIAPSKRNETVLNAFRELQRLYPRAELHFYGQVDDVDYDYAQSLISQSPAQVYWQGGCPDLSFYAQDWLAQITLGTNQGCPNAVLEACARGLCVIANDSGGTHEALHSETDLPAGILLAEDTSVEELLQALLQLCQNPQQAQRYGSNGRLAMQRHFSMEAFADRYKGLIESMSPLTEG